jgi:hypothetical protein
MARIKEYTGKRMSVKYDCSYEDAHFCKGERGTIIEAFVLDSITLIQAKFDDGNICWIDSKDIDIYDVR